MYGRIDVYTCVCVALTQGMCMYVWTYRCVCVRYVYVWMHGCIDVYACEWDSHSRYAYVCMNV
jgi:hypothetical protein